MPVYNGQDVSAEITNPAFLDAQDDDTAAGRISFHNTDVASGANVDNIQRNINSICSALGINANEVYNYLITWANSYVGLSSSDAKAKIESLVNRFLAVGGHAHTAVNGEGPKISAYDLASFNFFSAEWQSKSLTGISGTSTDISIDMALENPNGMSSNLGVITFPPNNRVWILNSSDETFYENATGQRVYGRITYAATVWTLSYYVNIAGVETAFTMPVSNVKIYFLKVFDQNTRPSIPEMPGVFGTMDLTSDIIDASPTQRGLVNLLAQSFFGSKTFQSITNVSNATQSTTSADGALIVTGGIGVAKNLNVGGSVVITNDLTVNGTTTTLNTQTLDVTDSNITVNKNGNDASSEGAGLTVSRTGTAGSIIYASAATSKYKCGPLGTEVEIATISNIQALTNKTLDNTNSVTLLDTNFTIQDNGNVTKQAKFDAALITAGQTRTYSLPDQDGTLSLDSNVVHLAGTETMTGAKIFNSSASFNEKVNLSETTDSTSTGAAIALTIAKSLYRLTNAGVLSVGTITSPVNGQFVILENDTGNSITILNENGATSTERILTGTGSNLTLSHNGSIELVYSQGKSRWQVVGGSGSGGSSSTTVSAEVALTIATTTATITFVVPQANTNYVVMTQMVNTVDANPIFQTPVVTNKTTSGFTIKWNSALDSSNYFIDYTIAGNGYQSGEVVLTTATTSVVVTIPVAFSSTNYVAICEIVNTVDANPAFQPVVVTAKTTATFTVKWNSALDSGNYKLSYYLF